MKARAVQLLGPRQVQLVEVTLPPLGAGDVLVEAEASALSAGTERLVFRGELEPDALLDEALDGQRQASARYPLAYGYCSVGRVREVGAQVTSVAVGQRVFGFRPHQSHWVAPAGQLVSLPETVSAAQGTFLANVETAVSLVMAGAPLLGEAVAIVGAGVVGQLVAALLSRLALGPVGVVEPRAERLALACRLSGVQPVDAPADLVFELSGRPEALETALSVCRRHGRVVVGSWYGTRAASLTLGTAVHRGHQTISFSNVSELPPALAGRFDKARRMGVARSWLPKLPLDGLVTHQVPLARWADAFSLLDESPPGCLQVVLTYP